MANKQSPDLHIRRSIKQIDTSIAELQKARAALVAMLPQKKVDVSSFTVRLPSGKVIDCNGKVVP